MDILQNPTDTFQQQTAIERQYISNALNVESGTTHLEDSQQRVTRAFLQYVPKPHHLVANGTQVIVSNKVNFKIVIA